MGLIGPSNHCLILRNLELMVNGLGRLGYSHFIKFYEHWRFDQGRDMFGQKSLRARNHFDSNRRKLTKVRKGGPLASRPPVQTSSLDSA